MSDHTTIDPYKVLGISKDATIGEIKSAHRKLVLRCHPDKIKDEEQRKEAVPEFQRVQSAYELLSDEKKRADYDLKVELKKKPRYHSEDAGSSSYYRPSTFTKSYESRNGVIYEERVPRSSRFFDEDIPLHEEPRPTSRKNNGYEKKHSTEGKEKKKSRHVDPPVSVRSSKERVREARESVKSSRSDREKHRDKERRKDRERSDKYPKAFVVSEPDGESDLDSDHHYYTPRTPEPEYEDPRTRVKPSSSESKPKQTKVEEYSDEWSSSKLDDAKKYTVVDESEDYVSHRAVRIDPSAGFYTRNKSVSPTRVPQMPRSRTFNYPIDPVSMPIRHDSSRSIPTLRTTPPTPSGLGREGLFGEVFPGEYDHPKIVIPEGNIRYSPRIREEDISYSYSPRKGPVDPNENRETYPRPYGSRKESVTC
ncbi:predicted protein [Histoplasma mississippiense (nom. inval.)]|uniref:predicted protein n=1 Tax=Ajellomyces capsulatus (strain NAm1 / WU24) TaxID=2059318 RepID=UPI000157B2C0|nr:predicted protein [Histoplasma mississippiense (nom. inval.)]EDN02297.1 predicted protein [Histoplasma mississippiense (nom. inval.)]